MFTSLFQVQSGCSEKGVLKINYLLQDLFSFFEYFSIIQLVELLLNIYIYI